MITRIELTNFMSHVHTVIEPAAGLTVLVGANNVGKSAVVAALQILARNDKSTYVMRHGEKSCSVKVETDDGQVVEWRRKQSPSYVINGQLFDRLRGGDLPAELHQVLRLPSVDHSGDSDFDIHFGMQKSPIFLLGKTGSVAARFFASSSDAIRLVEMQKRHKDKYSAAKREKEQLDQQAHVVQTQLECLAPIVDLNGKLQLIENLHAEVLQSQHRIETATKDVASIDRQVQHQLACQAHADSLNRLHTPPEMFPVGSLEALLRDLKNAQLGVERASGQVAALTPLRITPELAPVAPVRQIIDDLEAARMRYERGTGLFTVLASVVPVPTMNDIASLFHQVRMLDQQARAVQGFQASLQAASSLAQPPGMQPTLILEQVMLELNQLHEKQSDAHRVSHTFNRLTPPPRFEDSAELGHCLHATKSLIRQCEMYRTQFSHLCDVAPPSTPIVTESLAVLVNALGEAVETHQLEEESVTVTRAELELLEQGLRSLAAESVCALCGSPLDPDRVMAHAASGLGGHTHE